MSISVWTDEDFSDENLTRLETDDLDTLIVKHQTRQRSFYSKCIKVHQEFNRTWTAFIDAGTRGDCFWYSFYAI